MAHLLRCVCKGRILDKLTVKWRIKLVVGKGWGMRHVVGEVMILLSTCRLFGDYRQRVDEKMADVVKDDVQEV